MNRAGVIHEDVHAAEALLHFCEQLLCAAGVAKIGLERGGACADGFGGVDCGATVSMDSHLRACLRERCGDCRAESAGCARDESDTAIETEEIKDGRGHGSPGSSNRH